MAKTPRGRGGGGSPRDLFRQAQTRAVGAAAQTSTSPGVTTPPVSSRAVADPPKKKVPPGQFIREVRAEGRKITWPSGRETWITSVMVMIMVLVTTLFFWIVDAGLAYAIQGVLRLAGGA